MLINYVMKSKEIITARKQMLVTLQKGVIYKQTFVVGLNIFCHGRICNTTS